MAEASGHGWETITAEGCGGKSEALAFVEKNLFLYKSGEFAGDRRGVAIFRAGAPDLECEAAASKVLELLREGYRLRDIAVAVCDWAAYGTLAENIFEKYGIPVFVSKKTDIRAMPPAALIENALETVTGGWEYENVFAYLKTGLTGIGAPELDALENYVLKWNLKGSIWTRDDGWTFPVSGYEEERVGGARELEIINETRRAVAGPLKKLQKALKAAAFGDKLRALYMFLEDIGLPERIREKSEHFIKSGELQLGEAYRQFWEILVRAFDQFFAIAGDITGSTDEFARLWRLLISQYDLGSIPISLDRISLGDISRVRRRGCRCLIVIGAADDALPGAPGPAALISDGERRDLKGLGLTLPGSAEDRLYRELNMIYSVFSMPSDVLFVTWPESSPGGGEKRPSFVVRRIKDMFSLQEESDGSFRFRLSAVRPAFELAASAAGNPLNPAAAAAAACIGRDAGVFRKAEKN
jgi:ATP-dependent helicase/nuclease subunit B